MVYAPHKSRALLLYYSPIADWDWIYLFKRDQDVRHETDPQQFIEQGERIFSHFRKSLKFVVWRFKHYYLYTMHVTIFCFLLI